jgi:hypothetical protein
MFGRKTDKEKNRFYLFPGQGGVALRRKKRMFLVWSAVVALLLSAVLGALMYWLDRVNPH